MSLIALCCTSKPIRFSLSLTAFLFTVGNAFSGSNCPASCTCHFDSIHVKDMKVDCVNAGLTALPSMLPQADRYVLRMSRNKISLLDEVWYLHQTTYLDLSDNELTIITPQAWAVIDAHVRFILLSHNQLTSVPLISPGKDLHYTNVIKLDNNPWACNCSDADPFTFWIRERDNLESHEDIICHQDNERCSPFFDDIISTPPPHSHSLGSQDKQQLLHKQIILSCCGILLAVAFIYTAVLLLHHFTKERKDRQIKQLTQQLNESLPAFGPAASPLLERRASPGVASLA